MSKDSLSDPDTAYQTTLSSIPRNTPSLQTLPTYSFTTHPLTYPIIFHYTLSINRFDDLDDEKNSDDGFAVTRVVANVHRANQFIDEAARTWNAVANDLDDDLGGDMEGELGDRDNSSDEDDLFAISRVLNLSQLQQAQLPSHSQSLFQSQSATQQPPPPPPPPRMMYRNEEGGGKQPPTQLLPLPGTGSSPGPSPSPGTGANPPLPGPLTGVTPPRTFSSTPPPPRPQQRPQQQPSVPPPQPPARPKSPYGKKIPLAEGVRATSPAASGPPPPPARRSPPVVIIPPPVGADADVDINADLDRQSQSGTIPIERKSPPRDRRSPPAATGPPIVAVLPPGWTQHTLPFTSQIFYLHAASGDTPFLLICPLTPPLDISPITHPFTI